MSNEKGSDNIDMYAHASCWCVGAVVYDRQSNNGIHYFGECKGGLALPDCDALNGAWYDSGSHS